MRKNIGILLVSLVLIFTNFSAVADKYWEQKVSLFNLLPIGREDIVFLGNSITDGGNFEELFNRKDVKNRGIRSDAIPGIMKRLDQVTKGSPKKIFLLIGINDVSHGLTIDALAARYENLVDEIMKKTPSTQLYIQSVMPINNSFGVYKSLKDKENTVKEFNEHIKGIADSRGLKYVDLWNVLADANGSLKKEYTNDGLHLTGAGYRAWTGYIEKYLDE